MALAHSGWLTSACAVYDFESTSGKTNLYTQPYLANWMQDLHQGLSEYRLETVSVSILEGLGQ